MKMNLEKLLFISCSCLLASVVFAQGGPKLDLGPLSDDEDTERTCADVMAVFDWISCEDDGSFSALQCNPANRRCYCLRPDGTRASNKVFRQDRVSADTCNQPSTCPELRCQRLCDDYSEDPRTGCKTCECELEDDEEDCPTADELVAKCARRCIRRDDDGCLECMENCSGNDDDDDDDDDECEDDECPSGGICVARGNFATRKCLKSEREDGQMCERDEDDSVQDINARRLLRGAASRRNIRNFRPARTPCKNGSVCVPYDARTGVCQQMDDIDGSCFNNNTGLECDDSGMFRPVQCSDDSCWCVDPENGTEIPNTRVDRRRTRVLPDCFDLAYESCVIVVRGDRYRIEHNRFGLDVSRCRRCLCQNGQLNDSTCVNGRSCVFITPGGGRRDCNFNGVQYRHGDVFPVDECNRCKCLNGRMSGCTRRKCRNDDDNDDDDDDTPCDRCRKMPYDPVCGPNGVTYRNLCTAQFCAGLDPLEVTPGPCSTQDPCENFPCEEGLTCVPRKITCTTRRGCSPDQYRMCINDTDIDCPVDDDDEEVCGNDGKTYSSVCRMLIESDDVYAIYDGPCNRTECEDAPVCGTDFVTYPNICVLRSQSSNTRADYEGTCEEPSGEETLDQFCERIRATRCSDLTGCDSIVQPTDGCCPICGGIVTVALDEEGLAEYAELFNGVQSLDGLLENIVVGGTIPDSVLNTCEISAYITSTGNLEILFEAIDVADAMACFMAAESFTEFINEQGDGAISEITPDPVVSFLTAASSLEQEEAGGSITTDPTGDSGSSHILPPASLLLCTIILILLG